MQFYNSSTVTTTEDGFLKISTKLGVTEWNRYDHVKRRWKHEKTHYLSGMVQSWEKFCFTGGIVEIDVIFPGDPFIGGLWPAVWMLGNLGRATYEASTNNIWPWSYDKCDRELQEAQTLSACNKQNHYGLNPHQGRGATEIDIVEVMAGDSNGPLPSTDPPVSIPYADMTLQVCAQRGQKCAVVATEFELTPSFSGCPGCYKESSTIRSCAFTEKYAFEEWTPGILGKYLVRRNGNAGEYLHQSFLLWNISGRNEAL
jgi:hypothetical protein